MAKRRPKSSKPYDATFKHLIEAHPLDALALVGITNVDRVEIVDADVSAIAAAVDKALKVTVRQTEFLVHLEFQSGHDADLVERLFWYNAVLYHRHRLPVQTVLVLLTPAADSPRVTDHWDVCSGWGSLPGISLSHAAVVAGACEHDPRRWIGRAAVGAARRRGTR